MEYVHILVMNKTNHKVCHSDALNLLDKASFST